MTSARSFKNPEKAWLVETLRRYKALPVLIAVAYFLVNILPVLLSYNQLEEVIPYVYSSMTGANFLNMMIAAAGGIIVSCAVFRYLHDSASVTSAHSRPLTRVQLFRGAFFAGLIMIAGPVVLTGLFYLCVMGADISVGSDTLVNALGMEYTPEQILNVPNVIGWILDNILLIGFMYCVSCFAAILAGSSVIQILLSLFLTGLPAAIYLIFKGYMNTFLFGYDDQLDISGYLLPYVYLLGRDAFPFTQVPLTLIVYALVSVILVLAAMLIYKKIKLENEEKSIVVPVVAEILVILLTVIAVSTALFILVNFATAKASASSLITIILATIVFFPIFCMIADQSLKVFTKKNVRIFIGYAAVMCLILAFTMMDVTGFEKKVPSENDVASVTVSDGNLINTEVRNIKDKETIHMITDIHEAVKGTEEESNKMYYEGANAGNGISGIDIEYTLKNGKKLSRSYPYIMQDAFDEYARFYDSQEIRKHDCIDENKPLVKGQYMSVVDNRAASDGSYDENTYKVPDQQIRGIVRAANKDIMNWTADNRKIFDSEEEYDPATDNSAYMLQTCVDYSISHKNLSKLEEQSRYYMFTTDDKNICKYIEDHKILSKKNMIQDDDPILGVE